MRSVLRFLLTSISLACALSASAQIHHYAFFGPDREQVHDKGFLSTKAFEGAQMHFSWRELEPTKDHYNFESVRQNLAFLKAHGKKLWIQLQEVTFAANLNNAPKYLMTDPAFHGGVAQQFDTVGDDDSKATPAGWLPRRWDPAVRGRFAKLLSALGKEFDGKIGGINLPETAADFGVSGMLYPPDFTPDTYEKGIIADMTALKKAFPHAVVMQYANFMPGEWLPDENNHHLENVFAAAKRLGVAIGGPDLLPNHPPQMHHIYHFLPGCRGIVPTGIAVQDGNYAAIDSRLGRADTIKEKVTFARDVLGVSYIFWCTEQPYFSKQVIPYLKRL